MGKQVQIIVTSGGERLAVLPESDYLRLCDAAEELADIAAFDKAECRLANGSDELIASAEIESQLFGGSASSKDRGRK